MFIKLLKKRCFHKVLTVALLCLGAMTLYEYVLFNGSTVLKVPIYNAADKKGNERILNHYITVQNFYEKRKNWVTSNLGKIMFKNATPPSPRSRTYFVLVWKYWSWLKQRHVEGFKRGGLLNDCSVHNCIFSGKDQLLDTANAVVVHIQHGVVPVTNNRNPYQRWVFLSDESPKNTFTFADRKPNLKNWANIFNWSMTYRSDADVPVPYGRTLPFQTPLMPNVLSETIKKYVPYWEHKQRKVLVTILTSNCRSERMKYLTELQKYIDVTIYGKCAEGDDKMRCPGHFGTDCTVINKYLFYLAFENSKCRQYLTEKSFYNAYSKGSIPIIMGLPIADCEKLLPPNSFLHVDEYDSPEDLAKDILRISRNEDVLLSYHKWRNNFEVVNEHGYFTSKSYHLCRICEALNYNDETASSYSLTDLEMFLDAKFLCLK